MYWARKIKMLNAKQQYITNNPCLEMAEALAGDVFVGTSSPDVWSITCACCGGGGEHNWSPSGYNVDPDSGVYPCGICFAEGQFHINTEPSATKLDEERQRWFKEHYPTQTWLHN